VRPGDVIVLAGEMGAGKTAFAQGFGRALGIEDPMTSPTFTLVHSYDVPPPPTGPARAIRLLHHADLYRLERTTEVADLALNELAEFGGVVLVEWGDVVDGVFADHLVVLLDHDDLDADGPDGETAVDPDDDSDVLALDGRRIIGLSGVGASWASRWDRLVRLVEDHRC
jgi:tRNA threonylcarbamoyladenosine biosynthesis protein TsaE